MNFDDEKAKIRRNLVVFCAVYLGFAYLGISIHELFSDASFFKNSRDISSDKILIVSGVVFLYLSWRWMSSDEQREQFGHVAQGFLGRLKKSVDSWVMNRARRMKFDEYFKCSSYEEQQKLNNWLNVIERKIDHTGDFSVELHSSGEGFFSGEWSIRIAPNVKNAAGIGGHVISFGALIPFGLRIPYVLIAFLNVFSRAAFWEWVPPAVLMVLTFGVFIFRVWVSWF